MKTLIAICVICAATVQAQMVEIVPTNYVMTIRSQNNTGKFFASWHDEKITTVSLSNRIKTVTHTVLFEAVPSYGSRWGGPKAIEDTYWHQQIGAATYIPLGGQNVTYFVQRKDGTWISNTNHVPASAMQSEVWLPLLVGTVTTGDKYMRTITTGSTLECFGRNLSGTPQLIRIKCSSENIPFDYIYRFEGNQRKLFTLGLHDVNTFFNSSLDYFIFDVEETTDEEAQ